MDFFESKCCEYFNATGNQGLATGISPGQTTISATLNGVSGSTTLTVTSAVLLSIQVTPVNPSIAAGFEQQFTAMGLFSDQTTEDLTDQVIWTSSNPGVASISNEPGSQGLATGISPGSTMITAAIDAISGSTTLTVTSATLLSLEVTPLNPTIATGFDQQFTAMGLFSDQTTEDLTDQVMWTSSNPVVASISNLGLATGLSPGSTIITATIDGVSGSTTLTVTSAILISIEVTPINATLASGYTQQFTAIGTFSDGTTENLTDQVTWTSSQMAIAVISNAPGSHGLATGLSRGSTTITAQLKGVTGSTLLTVTPAMLVTIILTPVDPMLAIGFTQQFTAIGTFSNGTTENLTTQVAWFSSNTDVAEINNAQGSQGLATGLSKGSTTITAQLNGVSGSTSLTVTSAVLESISVTPVDTTLPTGLTLQFTAIGTFSDGTTEDLTNQVTWISSQIFAFISNAQGSQGLATGLTPGNTTITAQLNGVSGSTSLTVTSAVLDSIVVTPADTTLPAGFTLQFTAIGTF